MLNLYKPPLESHGLRMHLGGLPYDTAKRHAIYVPSKACFDENWNIDDDESTWEFSAPMASMARSSSTDTCSSMSSSAAQDIVYRYRAGLPLEAVVGESTSCSSSRLSGDTRSAWETALEDTTTALAQLPLPIQAKDHNLPRGASPSRTLELSVALQEALECMEKDRKTENDQLVCHRSGCRDVVHNAQALMYHIHIHNIHDE
ncbi:hypothetical protein H0H87_001024 [Tephrocybe sp. NHM501043]|nr:hypothetical protein H0H87_001024 [Tephrocybe sp. NHM501043]